MSAPSRRGTGAPAAASLLTRLSAQSERASVQHAGPAQTAAAGAAQLISLALSLSERDAPVDPAWFAVAAGGLPLLHLSVTRLVRNRGMKKISSALLITIAMVAALGVGDVFAAGEVAFIMSLGALLEDMTVRRARRGLHRLVSLMPQRGRRLVDGREEMVDAAEIRPGDEIRVLAGETVPVDGRVIRGASSVDESVLTGESLPVDRQPGDPVCCGSVNRFGVMDLVATAVGEDSSLKKLIRMVEEAGRNRAPMERIADVWATWLVPLALLIAVVAGLATGSLTRAVTVLVVFCPCALVLATPTAVMAAIGQATKHGVVIRSGAALERMGAVDAACFDKTGTLTLGRPAVSDIVPMGPGMDERALLGLAASLESLSGHPLAKAVRARADEDGVEPPDGRVEDVVMAPGRRLRGHLGRSMLRCGSLGWLEQEGVRVPVEAAGREDGLRSRGCAVFGVARDDSFAGLIGLSDTMRDGAAAMIRRLEAAGARAVLLTGDQERTARHLAGQAGLKDVRAGLLPEGKVAAIRRLQAEGRTVCMIGDGVNDAPALKAADVGVAMGAIGSDIAVEAADIVLVGDDIDRIPYLRRLAGAAVSTIRLSIALSLVINACAITLSVMGLLTPTTGALVHNAGSVLVVLIAALLYDRDFLADGREGAGAGIPRRGGSPAGAA